MTIDDAIGHCDVTADVAEAYTYKQIAEKYREIGKWLRELKALKDGDMVSRQDAPDTNVGDTVYRKQAIDAIDKYDFCYPKYMERFVSEIRDAIKADIKDEIEQLPSAEPTPSQVARDIATIIENEKDMCVISERKTGRWIYGEDDSGQDGWTCSECGFFVPWYYDYYGMNNIDFIRDFHTCPHCDAKMLTYTGKEDGGGAWEN